MVRNGLMTDSYVFVSGVRLANVFSSKLSLGVSGSASAAGKTIDVESSNKNMAMVVMGKRFISAAVRREEPFSILLGIDIDNFLRRKVSTERMSGAS